MQRRRVSKQKHARPERSLRPRMRNVSSRRAILIWIGCSHVYNIRMLRRVPGFFTLLFLCCSTLLQSQAPSSVDFSQEAFVFEHLNESVRFENDGSGVRETTAAIRINSQAAVQAFGQLVFGYSTANEDLIIDYVRVRKTDGHVVETPASTAQDFAPEVLREAPMYSDYRQRHISVVELQPGTTLEYHMVTHVKPLASGEFWYEYSFPTGWALADGTLQINIPKSREIKLKSPDHKYQTQESGDRRVYSWSVKDFVPKRGKRQDEEEKDETPDVQLSSFSDWQQVARWYSILQSERAVPDETIRKKAAELTRGASSTEEKARRLYSFVALNTRYVSLSFGIGRLQPHPASEVLQNQYGDCKDKHTLLQALLAAQGIQSFPVLIHSERKLDPDVPSPSQFDHVITAVKVGDNLTWLDSTAEVAPYGLIEYQLRNKQAVIASTGSDGGLRRTPAESSVHNRTELSLKAKIDELGAMNAEVELTAIGDSDWPLRAAFRRLPQTDWNRALEYFLASGASRETSRMPKSMLSKTRRFRCGSLIVCAKPLISEFPARGRISRCFLQSPVAGFAKPARNMPRSPSMLDRLGNGSIVCMPSLRRTFQSMFPPMYE